MSLKNSIKKASAIPTRLISRSENFNEHTGYPRPRRPRRPTCSVVYSKYRSTLFSAYQEGSIKNLENYFRIVSMDERRKIFEEKRKEFQMHTILYMAVHDEKYHVVKYLWEMGARDPDAYDLAKKKGGEVLSLMEPKLADLTLSVGDCEICCESGAMFKLNCGHSYCYNCIQKWIQYSVNQMLPTIPTCSDCGQPITDNLEYFLDKKEIELYNDRILYFALNSIPGFIMCGNCNHGFIEESSCNCTTISCKECKYQWCRICNLALHSDLNCDQAKAKQSLESRQNQEWLNQNTQKCPRCHTMIEKNQGCNHMTCRYCHHEFCWICKSVWIEGEPCIH